MKTWKADADSRVRGSMIAVLKDGKPFKSLLMMGLKDFMKDKLYQAQASGLPPLMWKNHLLKSTPKAEWEQWYKVYIDKLRSRSDFDPNEI